MSHWEVLVIEDDEDSREVVEEALYYYSNDVSVYTASDGQAGLQMLETLHPTLIIVDLALPNIDGWETLNEIRHRPDIADIPVIAITAYHSVRVEESAQTVGFDAYYPKPIDIFTFGEELAALLRS